MIFTNGFSDSLGTLTNSVKFTKNVFFAFGLIDILLFYHNKVQTSLYLLA